MFRKNKNFSTCLLSTSFVAFAAIDCRQRNSISFCESVWQLRFDVVLAARRSGLERRAFLSIFGPKAQFTGRLTRVEAYEMLETNMRLRMCDAFMLSYYVTRSIGDLKPTVAGKTSWHAAYAVSILQAAQLNHRMNPNESVWRAGACKGGKCFLFLVRKSINVSFPVTAGAVCADFRGLWGSSETLAVPLRLPHKLVW